MLPTVLPVFVFFGLLPFAFSQQVLGHRPALPLVAGPIVHTLGVELGEVVPLARFVLEKMHYRCQSTSSYVRVCVFDSLVPGTAPLWCRPEIGPCGSSFEIQTATFTNLQVLQKPEPPGSPLFAILQASGSGSDVIRVLTTPDSVPCEQPMPSAIFESSSRSDMRGGLPEGLTKTGSGSCAYLAFEYSLRDLMAPTVPCDTDDLTCFGDFMYICDRNTKTYIGWDHHCEYGCVPLATECLGEFDDGAVCFRDKCDENNDILHHCINYEIDGGEQCEFGCREKTVLVNYTDGDTCHEEQFEVGAACNNGDLCVDDRNWQCVDGHKVAPVVCEFGCGVENASAGCLSEFEEFAFCNDSVCFSNTLWECVVVGEGISRYPAPFSCDNCKCCRDVNNTRTSGSGAGVSAGNVASYALNGILGAVAVVAGLAVVVGVGFLCHLNENGKMKSPPEEEEKVDEELAPLSYQSSPFVSVVREVVYGKPMSGTESRRMSMKLQQLTFVPLNSVYSEIRFVLDGGARKRGLQLMMGAGVRSRWITEAEIGSVDVNVMDDEGIVQVQMEMANGSLQVLDFDAEDHGALTQCMSCLLEIGA